MLSPGHKQYKFAAAEKLVHKKALDSQSVNHTSLTTRQEEIQKLHHA